MEILWWLFPAAVATLSAMCWVSWHERRAGREEDRDEAVARMGEALRREQPETRYTVPTRTSDRSSGVAVRHSRSAGPTQHRIGEC